MPRFRKYSPLYNSLLVLSVLITLACGPGLYDENEFHSYFMPTSAYTPPGAEPYYFSPAFLYTGFYTYWDAEPDYAGDPVLAGWKRYTHTTLSDSAAAALIYQGKDDTTSPLYRALQEQPAAWHYLLTARAIEEASAAGGTRWEPTGADTGAMRHLLVVVTDSLQTAGDAFLRDKYAFQAIKLTHLLGAADSCIARYDRYFAGRSDTSVMRYWSLSHQAGALLDRGDTARSIYVFAQVFDRCPSRRKQAYMSLRLHHLRFRPAALSYCKNEHEKAAVYVLCAIQPWQDGLPLLEDLARVNPRSPYLQFIMAREINKNEDAYYPAREAGWYRDTSGMAARHAAAGDYFIRLGRFAARAAASDSIPDHAFWYTAAAYIRYVEKDYGGATDFLARARAAGTDNAALTRQMLLEQVLVTVDQAPALTPAVEAALWPQLDSLKATGNASFYQTDALALATARLAERYKELAAAAPPPRSWFGCGRQTPAPRRYALAKAFVLAMLPSAQLTGAPFMSAPDQYAIEDTASETTLDSAIAFFAQPDPVPADSALMQLSGLNLNYLYLVKGRRKLMAFRYGEAAHAWRHVAESYWQEEPFRTYLAANPFAALILDTHAPTPADTVRYTPYRFALKMEQLARKARAGGAGSAAAYYQLGCGAYNMSYFGNSWLVAKRSWSSGELQYGLETPDPADSLNYYSTLRAQAYFDSAMERATDPELAASACFMAAKSEQNSFYRYASRNGLMSVLRGTYGRYGLSARRDSLKKVLQAVEGRHYRHYFGLLKHRYSDQAFTREVIRQCATYRDFTQGR